MKTTTNKSAIRSLSHLYKIVEAGERGYAVAASSVKNRAIKVLFKSYAQKRAQYKQEILQEIQRLGGNATPPSRSILGAIHRGRITIFATMTIGEENIERVVLKEVVLGESVAKRTYERILKRRLPDETQAMIQRQYDDIRWPVEQAQMMLGKNGKRLVVRMYDSERNADEAVRRLKASEYPPESIEKLAVTPIEIYTGSGTKVIETVLSGAVGGSIWGAVSGILAGASILETSQSTASAFGPLQIAAITLLGLVAAGAFVGASIGFFLGLGVKDEDTYLYNESIEHGRVLVQVLTNSSRASPTWRLLAQVNTEARAITR